MVYSPVSVYFWDDILDPTQVALKRAGVLWPFAERSGACERLSQSGWMGCSRGPSRTRDTAGLITIRTDTHGQFSRAHADKFSYYTAGHLRTFFSLYNRTLADNFSYDITLSHYTNGHSRTFSFSNGHSRTFGFYC